jgi:cell division septation protein DedD
MIGRRDSLREELSALDELDQEARRPVRRPSSLIVPILITMIVMTGSVTVAWYSYNAGVKEGSEGAAPLLKPAGPMKVAPDNPGGANIPHQEMSVYQSLNEKSEGSPVERILPPPERPLTPPVAAPAQPAGESSRVRSADSLPIAPPEAPKAGDSTPSARSLVPPPTALVPPKAQVAQANPKAAEPAPKEIKAAPVNPVDKSARTAAPVKPAAEPEQQIASIPAGAYRIQLGSVSSEGQASKFWSAQREKNGDLLGKLALNVEKTSVGGKVFYRIQAGPMKDAASARVLCDQLKQRQIGCIIVNPKK